MAQQPRSPVNLEQVRTELFAQGAPWTMGTTTVTELNEDSGSSGSACRSPRTATSRPARSSPPRWRPGLAPTADGGVGAGLPASFDARNVGGNSYVTPVKDQGDCGSCVAFGTLASLETTAAYTRGQPGLQLDLSEAHLFYTHGPTSGADCDGGWWPRLAFTACRDIGVTYEDYFPYSARNRPARR
jgi:hypothetical protein